MALIEVRGLSKFYGLHAAVRDVNFKINLGGSSTYWDLTARVKARF